MDTSPARTPALDSMATPSSHAKLGLIFIFLGVFFLASLTMNPDERFLPSPSSHTLLTHILAALPRHKIVAAPSAARVGELLAPLGGRVVIIARDGGRALPFVQRVQAEDGQGCGDTHKKTRVKMEPVVKADRDTRAALTFLGAAVLLAGGPVPEAVGVAEAAAVVEELALHAGHVEEVLPQQGPARTHLAGESADLGDFWRERESYLQLAPPCYVILCIDLLSLKLFYISEVSIKWDNCD